MDIWIPTRDRKVLATLNSFSPSLRARTIVAISPDNKYRDFDCKKVVMAPSWVRGIAEKRQWILSVTEGKFVMFDDDLTFAKRRITEPTKFIEATHKDIELMMEDIDFQLNTHAHVGVSTREGGNHEIEDRVANTRVMRVLAYRADILRQHDIRFDRCKFMLDFDVTLQLLRLGYENTRINWIVHNQKSSNAPGGCSIYRTMEAQTEDAFRLKALHPEFVTTVVKTTKSAWNGQTRTDVRIGWKKALGHDSAGKIAVVDSRAQSGNVEEGIGSRTALEL